jgi:hypothetical protein
MLLFQQSYLGQLKSEQHWKLEKNHRTEDAVGTGREAALCLGGLGMPKARVASGPAQGSPAAGRLPGSRRSFSFDLGSGSTGTAAIAEARSGMGIPTSHGTAPALETLSGE